MKIQWSPVLSNRVLLEAGAVNYAGNKSTVDAFAAGELDAYEFLGPGIDHMMPFGAGNGQRLTDVAKYMGFPGWHEPGVVLDIAFNLDTWNEFSEVTRSLLASSSRAAYTQSWSEWESMHMKGLQLIKSRNVTLMKRN